MNVIVLRALTSLYELKIFNECNSFGGCGRFKTLLMKIRELVGVAHAFTCPFACPSGVMAKKSWPVQFFVWFFRSYWDDWAQ